MHFPPKTTPMTNKMTPSRIKAMIFLLVLSESSLFFMLLMVLRMSGTEGGLLDLGGFCGNVCNRVVCSGAKTSCS